MRKASGFTIVEMSVVLVVMGILVSVAVAAPYLISSSRALSIWNSASERDIAVHSYILESSTDSVDSSGTNFGLPGNGNGKSEWVIGYTQESNHTGNEVIEYDAIISHFKHTLHPKSSCQSTIDVPSSTCAIPYSPGATSGTYALIDKTRASTVNTGDGDVFITTVYSPVFDSNVYLIGMADKPLTVSTIGIGIGNTITSYAYSTLYAGLNIGILPASTINDTMYRMDAKFDDGSPSTGFIRAFAPVGTTKFAFPNFSNGGITSNSAASVSIANYKTNTVGGIVAIQVGASFEER